MRDGVGDALEGAVVDHRSHEVAEVRHVAHADLVHHGHHAIPHLGPQRRRDVGARGGAALLALILEGAAHQPTATLLRLGRGVRHHEVLAAGFAHDARVRAVTVEPLRHAVAMMLRNTGVEP
jgi:hypothetical protein